MSSQSDVIKRLFNAPIPMQTTAGMHTYKAPQMVNPMDALFNAPGVMAGLATKSPQTGLNAIKFFNRPLSEGARQTMQLGLEVAPGSGDVIALNDSKDYWNAAFERFKAGDIFNGLSNSSMAIASAAGALPMVPHVAGMMKKAQNTELLQKTTGNTKKISPDNFEARMDRAARQGFMDEDWYHGTSRLDRLLEKDGLDPKRATSGAMPYFTNNPDIASNYATGKADTSRLSDYDYSYSDWFKVRAGRGKPKRLEDAWWHLDRGKREEVADNLRKLTLDDDNNIVFGDGLGGSQHWDYTLKSHRGNALAAARDLWLDSGTLYGDEEMFIDVLKKAGLDKQVIYDSPNMQVPGILPAKIRASNPLDTSDTAALEKVMGELKKAAKGKRYKSFKGGVDQWDKRAIGIREFIDRFEDDLAEGTTYAWTSIPDDVTKTLQEMGYDAVLDQGGKHGGLGHKVMIPFTPSQVRSKFAKFDQKQIDSKNLLATGLFGLIAGGALMEADDEQR